MKFEFNSLQEIEILDVLIVPVFKDEKLSREFSEIDKASDGALQKMLTTKDFVGKAFATHLIYPHNEKNGLFLVVKKPFLYFFIIFLKTESLLDNIFFAFFQ